MVKVPAEIQTIPRVSAVLGLERYCRFFHFVNMLKAGEDQVAKQRENKCFIISEFAAMVRNSWHIYENRPIE